MSSRENVQNNSTPVLSYGYVISREHLLICLVYAKIVEWGKLVRKCEVRFEVSNINLYNIWLAVFDR